MNPKLATIAIVALLVLMFGQRFFHSVPAGHVGVAILFGQVQDDPYPEGLNIVNPLLSWVDLDARQDSFKITQLEMPTRDQLLSKVDMSIQWRLDQTKAPALYRDTGDKERMVQVHLHPKARSLIRELGTKIERAEDLFKDEVRDSLAQALSTGLATVHYFIRTGAVAANYEGLSAADTDEIDLSDVEPGEETDFGQHTYSAEYWSLVNRGEGGIGVVRHPSL